MEFNKLESGTFDTSNGVVIETGVTNDDILPFVVIGLDEKPAEDEALMWSNSGQNNRIAYNMQWDYGWRIIVNSNENVVLKWALYDAWGES